MAWDVTPLINDGYPYNDNFIGIISDIWTPGKHNYSLWRIDPDGVINDGYPYTYYMQEWLGEGGGGEEGDGTIDVSGHGNTYGTIKSATPSHMNIHKTDMKGTSNPLIGQFAANALNAYCGTAASAGAVRSSMATFPTDHPALTAVYSEVFGGNVYNSVVLCQAFPFEIPASATTQGVSTAGITLASSTTFGLVDSLYVLLDFGTVSLNITTSYEVEQYKYQIYLPYAGIYSLNLTTDEDLTLQAFCDLLQGTIDYVLYQDDIPVFMASGKCGIQIPFNVQSAQRLQNALANTVSAAAALSGTGFQIAGMAGAPLEMAQAGATATNMIQAGASRLNVPVDRAQLYSGLGGCGMYQRPTIIVHKQPIYNSGFGYANTQGYTKKRFVNDLTGETGFIKCVNYRCQLTGATAGERTAIEDLFNSGIYV